MSTTSKSRVGIFAVVSGIIVFWVLFLPVPIFIFVPFDSARLAAFRHRIADADRVVGTHASSAVSVTLTGDDAVRLIRAVSSASSHRPPYGMASSCSFLGKATFFKGTNILDHIEICSSLFLIHYNEPPFQDDSGLLDTLVYTPVVQAMRDEPEKAESR
jgi:hypothetical protein